MENLSGHEITTIQNAAKITEVQGLKEMEKVGLMKRITECEDQISIKEKEILELRRILNQKEEKISSSNLEIQETQEQIRILSSKLESCLDENNKLKVTLEEQQLIHHDTIR